MMDGGCKSEAQACLNVVIGHVLLCPPVRRSRQQERVWELQGGRRGIWGGSNNANTAPFKGGICQDRRCKRYMQL